MSSSLALIFLQCQLLHIITQFGLTSYIHVRVSLFLSLPGVCLIFVAFMIRSHVVT